MQIGGKSYKIVVLMLLQPKEVDVTIQAIESLISFQNEEFTVCVCLNGGSSPKLRNVISKVSDIKYYELPENMGVAGGRNILLHTNEAKAADILFLLDNDVIVPFDYIRRLSNFLVKQKDAGVIGPAMADINYLTFHMAQHYGETGIFGNKTFLINSADIKKNLITDFNPERIYHLGTHPNIFFSYFSILPRFLKIFSSMLYLFGYNVIFDPILKNNTRYHDLIMQGKVKIEVTNVGGGTQVFKRELIEKIGYFDNRFNPFGFEDVEFCIRARKAGYKNYIDLNSWLFHGTDQIKAKPNSQKLIENIYRCLTHCAITSFNSRFRAFAVIFKLIFFDFLLDFLNFDKKSFKRTRARYSGFKIALREQKKNYEELSHIRKYSLKES
jgi:GT2 family glycosyltransferase